MIKETCFNENLKVGEEAETIVKRKYNLVKNEDEKATDLHTKTKGPHRVYVEVKSIMGNGGKATFLTQSGVRAPKSGYPSK